MKQIVLIFLIVVLYGQCSAQRYSATWVVKDVLTNYVQKGIEDVYELPTNLKGKRIQIQDSLITIPEIRKNYIGTSLSDEFGDTIILEKKIFFKRQKDNEFTLQYPGDEFAGCVRNNNDTCFASDAFFNLLKVKGNDVHGYLSLSGKHSHTKCILFILKENNVAVLYSENDFLLLFLAKNE